MSDNKESLYTRIARVMGKLGYLPKEGSNAHFNYKFVTDNTVYDSVRTLLSEEGIAVLANMIGSDQTEFNNAKGTRTVHSKARFEFILACGDTGEVVKCLWESEADDQGDKGLNKCATAALKYWLLKTFMIPTGDDPDADDDQPAPAVHTPVNPRVPMGREPGATTRELSLAYQQPAEVEDNWIGRPGALNKFEAFARKEWDGQIKHEKHFRNRLVRALGARSYDTIMLDVKCSKEQAAAAIRNYQSASDAPEDVTE